MRSEFPGSPGSLPDDAGRAEGLSDAAVLGARLQRVMEDCMENRERVGFVFDCVSRGACAWARSVFPTNLGKATYFFLVGPLQYFMALDSA